MKKRPPKIRKYHLRRFTPKVFAKNTSDRNRHHEAKCQVSSTNKATPSEDLTAFQNKFNKATADNRILETNQLEKFREALIGNAPPRIPPDGIASVNDAWTILEKSLGDTLAHLNFHLGVMEATQPLSDKTIETDPNKAAAWLLQYEKAIEAILRSGDRSATTASNKVKTTQIKPNTTQQLCLQVR